MSIGFRCIRLGGVFTVVSLLSACGSDEPSNAFSTVNGSGFGSQAEEDNEELGDESANSQEANSGSVSGGSSSSDGGSASDTQDSDSHHSSSDGSNGEGSDPGNPESSGQEDGSTSPRFDVSNFDVVEQMEPKAEQHSFIWIPNSAEGTISKINTQTLVEKGRYPTGPTPNDPSRTSVDLNGDAVVAGRDGGITKIIADPKRCPDKDGSGSIETSMNSTPLSFEEDECIHWYVEAYPELRAVAWTQGIQNTETGLYSGQDVWIAGRGRNPDTEKPEIVLYDGDTGDRVGHYDDMPFSGYGGVVDEYGNFWTIPGVSSESPSGLVKVSIDDFTATPYENPVGNYGITYGGKDDKPGYIWTCSTQIGRFDPRTESWTTTSAINALGQSHRYGGCMVDANGVLWHASSTAPDPGAATGLATGIFGLDVETMDVVAAHELPQHANGVAIDFEGFVWAVGRTSNTAYKVDPVDGSYETYSDLVGAYSYSDMTGFALASANRVVID